MRYDSDIMYMENNKQFTLCSLVYIYILFHLAIVMKHYTRWSLTIWKAMLINLRLLLGIQIE